MIVVESMTGELYINELESRWRRESKIQVSSQISSQMNQLIPFLPRSLVHRTVCRITKPLPKRTNHFSDCANDSNVDTANRSESVIRIGLSDTATKNNNSAHSYYAENRRIGAYDRPVITTEVVHSLHATPTHVAQRLYMTCILWVIYSPLLCFSSLVTKNGVCFSPTCISNVHWRPWSCYDRLSLGLRFSPSFNFISRTDSPKVIITEIISNFLRTRLTFCRLNHHQFIVLEVRHQFPDIIHVSDSCCRSL